MPPDCVSPPDLRAALREVRVHPADVTGAMLAPFVPRLREVDQYRDPSLVRLAVALAGTSTIHAAATALIASRDWDVASVHYDLLEQVHRGFDSLSDDAPWQGVIDAAYAFADAMLARLVELAGPETTVWVVSPNGVRRDAALLRVAPWRPVGLIAASGRWIDPGTEVPRARLVDVVPSLLARFGLTTETDGAVLRALAPGASRRPIVVTKPAAAEPDLHVPALRALGYTDVPTAEQTRALERAEHARLLALGEALLGRGRVRDAETVLLQAKAAATPVNPGANPAGDPTVLRRLALCRLLRGDADGCRSLGATLREVAPQSGWGDLIIAAGFALEGKAEAAWPHMAAAREKSGHEPELLTRLGGIALMLKEDGSAIANFTRALALDPDLPAAQQGLGMARELAGRYDAAGSGSVTSGQ
jgi:tetratricopeptide (TPR) repeat protein